MNNEIKVPEGVRIMDEAEAQVKREFPYPRGGFETNHELYEWKLKTEQRFVELVLGPRKDQV